MAKSASDKPHFPLFTGRVKFAFIRVVVRASLETARQRRPFIPVGCAIPCAGVAVSLRSNVRAGFSGPIREAV